MPIIRDMQLSDIDRRALEHWDLLPISPGTQQNSLLARLMCLYLEHESCQKLDVQRRLKRCSLNPYSALGGQTPLSPDLEALGEEMHLPPELVPMMWGAWIKNYDEDGRGPTGSSTWQRLSSEALEKRETLAEMALEAAGNMVEALLQSSVASPPVALVIAREECDALLGLIGELEVAVRLDIGLSVT